MTDVHDHCDAMRFLWCIAYVTFFVHCIDITRRKKILFETAFENEETFLGGKRSGLDLDYRW